MEYFPFPARLVARAAGIEAHGSAVFVPRQEDAIEFSGEFVPLLSLGTPCSVEWVAGGEAITSYAGRSYLSTSKLVRVVGISPQVSRGGRFTLASNTRLPAKAAPLHGGPAAAALRWSPAEILYLARERMTLLCGDMAQEGGRLVLSAEVDFLTLRSLPLAVHRRVPVDSRRVLLLCEVQAESHENLIALSAYAARLNNRDSDYK